MAETAVERFCYFSRCPLANTRTGPVNEITVHTGLCPPEQGNLR